MRCVVKRVLIVFGLLSCLSGTTFALVPGMTPACEESCPDDQSPGRCSPLCQDCACHVCSVRVPIPRPTGVSPVVSSAGIKRQVPTNANAPIAPDPGDILHVPKSLRA
jgi:hypothetical protein